MTAPPNEISIKRHTSIAARQKSTLRDTSNITRIHQSRAEGTIKQNN
ncbi:unnamed protein product, partial [Rotaria magnacalcarata]